MGASPHLGLFVLCACYFLNFSAISSNFPSLRMLLFILFILFNCLEVLLEFILRTGILYVLYYCLITKLQLFIQPRNVSLISPSTLGLRHAEYLHLFLLLFCFYHPPHRKVFRNVSFLHITGFCKTIHPRLPFMGCPVCFKSHFMLLKPNTRHSLNYLSAFTISLCTFK